MCLGVPGELTNIDSSIGTVKIGDTDLYVGLDLVPEVKVGDYVLVHAGFAVQIIDREEALETWQLIKELAAYDNN